MSENRNRDFSKYDSMATEELEEILRLDAEAPEGEGADIELVLHIMEVLANRKKNSTNPGKTAQEAFESFKQNYLPEKEEGKIVQKGKPWGRIMKIVSAAAIACVLLVVVPQRAEAEGFFERLVRWSDTIFELFSSGTVNDNHGEYVFETDNSGLRQVYDTVVEMGVTEPVIPMWLPEGYELTACRSVETSRKKEISAEFANGGAMLYMDIAVYKDGTAYEYHKDTTPMATFEGAGVKHNIMRNNDNWVVIWTRENMECFITVDCQEDILYRILESIYVMEDD